MVRKARQPETVWSYPVIADEVPTSGRDFTLSPDEAARKSLASRLGLVSVDALEAKISIHKEGGGHIIKATGSLTAQVTQSCVVTLEPVKAEIEDSFEAWYADHDQAASFKRAQHEAMSKKELMDVPMLEESDDPEPIEDGKIDLAELVAQYLSLSLDPYPHKEGINYENIEPERKPVAKEALRPNPFAALKNWRPQD